MEGEITVKSPPSGSNKGSEFTVSLPLTKVADTGEGNIASSFKDQLRSHKTAASENKTVITNGHNAAKPLILLVEDNADVVAYTASCLARLSPGSW